MANQRRHTKYQTISIRRKEFDSLKVLADSRGIEYKSAADLIRWAIEMTTEKLTAGAWLSNEDLAGIVLRTTRQEVAFKELVAAAIVATVDAAGARRVSVSAVMNEGTPALAIEGPANKRLILMHEDLAKTIVERVGSMFEERQEKANEGTSLSGQSWPGVNRVIHDA